MVCANNHGAELGGETEPGVLLANLSSQNGLQVQCQKIRWTGLRRHQKSTSGLYTCAHMYPHECTCMHMRAQVQPPTRVHPLTKGGGREEEMEGGGRKIGDEREKGGKEKGGEEVSYLCAPTLHRTPL